MILKAIIIFQQKKYSKNMMQSLKNIKNIPLLFAPTMNPMNSLYIHKQIRKGKSVKKMLNLIIVDIFVILSLSVALEEKF